ncbi:MAG: hypothetical protein Q8P67_12710 [archaeon]|nr:hypothetical protein [archaeon]
MSSPNSSPAKAAVSPTHTMATRSRAGTVAASDRLLERLSRRIETPASPPTKKRPSRPSVPDFNTSPAKPQPVKRPRQRQSSTPTPFAASTSITPTPVPTPVPTPPSIFSSSTSSSSTSSPASAAAPVVAKPSLFMDVMKYLDGSDDSCSQPPLPPPSSAAPSTSGSATGSANKTAKGGGRRELLTSHQRERRQQAGEDIPMLYCDLDPSASRLGDSFDSPQISFLSSSDPSLSQASLHSPSSLLPTPTATPAIPVASSTAVSSPSKPHSTTHVPQSPGKSPVKLSWDSQSRSSADVEGSASAHPIPLTELRKHSVLKVDHTHAGGNDAPQKAPFMSLWSQIQQQLPD